MRRGTAALALLAAAAAPRGARATAAAFAQQVWLPLAQRPAAAAAPGLAAPVFVTASTNRMYAPDATKGAYVLDAFVYVAYRDDRFNASFVNPITSSPFADGDVIGFGATDWTPALEVINVYNGGLTNSGTSPFSFRVSLGTPAWVDVAALARAGAPLSVAPGGAWVVGESRQAAYLVALANLADFPYDSQSLMLALESASWEARDVLFFVVAAAPPFFVPDGHGVKEGVVPGWEVLGTRALELRHDYPVFNQSFSRVELHADVRRQSFYYTARFVYGAAFLNFMAIFTFFMRGTETDRLNYAQGSFLALILWEFVLVLSLPPLGYNTRMDWYMLASFGFIFAAYAWDALHVGFYKTIEVYSGRAVYPEDEADAAAALTKDEAAAREAARDRAAAARDRAAEREAVGADENGHLNSLTGMLRRYRWQRLCWGGSWAELNPHRKIDLLIGAGLCICYAISSWYILIAPR